MRLPASASASSSPLWLPGLVTSSNTAGSGTTLAASALRRAAHHGAAGSSGAPRPSLTYHSGATARDVARLCEG
eukprot:CAMPEP_0202106802 /NCGR_PEP_ID=MMETSP0965-20130614/13262_1 /ASSEMBLY_ACC=CAM_ASM_000507 /TAXON_ID=4773 /ORGANISM="Schizochytrium aggregatum, Strain ATCC28209" /LENGTH=73 /DNA_ID=CAMNT_0048675853 /DNA_START=124 /DNA_END=342 /DNA_ORIENTATION=-